MSEILNDAPRACVTGHPITHSRSPIIHNYWLKALGLNGHYGRVDTPPDVFPDFIRTMAAQGYVGCNVTLPNKEAAFRLAGKPTARAQKLQAANTLWFENGHLCADNTDIEGFVANLDQRKPGWDRNLEKAVVMGAGGAAAAIVQGLIERRAARIILVNRTRDKAEILSNRFGKTVEVMGHDEISHALVDADFLVNTTSLGMKGQPDLDLDLDTLRKDALVTDIVYVPLETGLLRAARLKGFATVDGLGMLLHQAVPGFEHWFGKRPDVTEELRALVEADIFGHRT